MSVTDSPAVSVPAIAGTTAAAQADSGGQAGSDSRQNADTYGWDTAFAISFANANTAITNSWPGVNEKAKNFSETATDDDSYNIAGVWGPWQLTEGGDGKNVRMLVPAASGTYHAGGKTYDLAGMQVVIEVGMEWVPDPGQFSFVIAGGEVGGIVLDLDHNTIDAALQQQFTSHGRTLTSAATALVQQQGLEWLITDGKDSYYIFMQKDKDNNEFLNVYQFETAWKNNLKILAQEVSQEQPAVAIITIAHNPTTGIPAAVLPDLLSTWFNVNIGELNHVFAALDLTPLVSDSDKFAWMKPTSTSYAVTDQGSLDTSIFGVLTMALDRPAGNNHQVSPFAIPSGKDANGADAGFLISGPDFLQFMMLAGAQVIFNNAPATSFNITNDGLTITNTADLVWGKFMMDDNKKGSVPNQGYTAELDAGILPAGLVYELQGSLAIYVSGYSVSVTTRGSQWLLSKDGQKNEYILNLDGSKLDVYLATVVSIPKGQFKMSLVNSYVEIQFIDLQYSYSSSFDVHVNYTEQVELTLQNKGGKNVFWYNQILQDMTVNVTKTQAAITREIVEGALTAALSLVAVVGPVIEGLSAGAEITGVTANEGSALVDSEAFLNVARENPEEVLANDALAGGTAAEQTGGRMTAIKNAFNTPKWKFVGALAGIAGAVTGLDTAISAIIEAAAKDQWENVPGFDDFAQLAITPYAFPSVAGFDLVSAWLAGSLQLGLKTKSSN
ncbi:MAG TPA: TULIP family P47-like protein [Longimicrobium sp.]|nr:TULIP family P47-like protein [Longimicrobium sp.]